MSEALGELRTVYDAATNTLNLSVIAQVATTDPMPTVPNLETNFIWTQVVDQATGRLRIVEVI